MKSMNGKASDVRRKLASGIVPLALVVLMLVVSGPLSPSAASAPEVGFYQTFLPIVHREAARNVWEGEYYSNATLFGTPTFTTSGEQRIDYNWLTGAPDARLPVDNFSVRWTGSWNMEVGTYTFFLYSDDGVRVWVDGVLLIDAWYVGIRTLQATRDITTAGFHEIKVEYYEASGGAAIRLNWRRTDIQPLWDGDYFGDLWLSQFKFSRYDSAVEFEWGSGSPDPLLPADSFSVAWYAYPTLAAGQYRAYIYADDGFQFKLDGTTILEAGWVLPRPVVDDKIDFTITTGGLHPLTLYYHERTGSAEARLLVLPYPLWSVEYYANSSLSGTPAGTASNSVPFHDWGLGGPAVPGLGVDNYSIRWTGERYFNAGAYRFVFRSDDGVRLYVDGELLVDGWASGIATRYSPVTFLDSGYHDMVIEYFEGTGAAEIRFWWE